MSNMHYGNPSLSSIEKPDDQRVVHWDPGGFPLLVFCWAVFGLQWGPVNLESSFPCKATLGLSLQTSKYLVMQLQCMGRSLNNTRDCLAQRLTLPSVIWCKLWLALKGSEKSRLYESQESSVKASLSSFKIMFSVYTGKNVVTNTLMCMLIFPHMHWALRRRDSDFYHP